MTKDTGQEYKTYEFTQNKAPDVVFEGRLVARIDSRDHVAENDRNRDRWTELAVYETPAGNWVAVQHGRSRAAGETDRTDVMYLDRTAQETVDYFNRPGADTRLSLQRAAMAAFGWGWLAKRMAELEGWDVRERYE